MKKDRPRFAGVLLDEVTLVMIALRARIGAFGVAPDSVFDGDHVFEDHGLQLTISCHRTLPPPVRHHQDFPEYVLAGKSWAFSFWFHRGLQSFDYKDRDNFIWNENYGIRCFDREFRGSRKDFQRDMTLAKMFYL